jgi:hypothetical protein
MSKKTLARFVAAAAVALQLTVAGTASAKFLRPPLVKVPVPHHASAGGPDKKMSDMDRDSCLNEGGGQWLCTGQDGHSYGCEYNPPTVDRCQRL